MAFFGDDEIPGTPGTLATTFLAFGMYQGASCFLLFIIGFLDKLI